MEREHTRSLGRSSRALVIGGGFAGLLAAKALAAHFAEVVVLERDRYPDDPVPRNGTPQDRHVHLLLLGGRQILESYFPGIGLELVKHGACVLETSRSISVLNYHGWSVRYPSEMKVISFTRPLLDWCMRRRVLAHPQVRVVQGCRATGLVQNRDEIAAVHRRGTSDLEADLIIDATGRFSKTPEWLWALGFGETDETVVDPRLGYASRLYHRSSDGGGKAVLLLGKPPRKTRGGVLLPVEEDRLVATLVGISGDYPPTRPEAFLDWTSSLRSGAMHDILKEQSPVTRISGFQATSNRLRHFERLRRWPKKLVVVGDAACALNPVYAQGMTVASLGVQLLDRLLEERLEDVGDRYRRALVRVHRLPWLLAVMEDFRWPGTQGRGFGPFGRLLHWYLDGVLAAATAKPAVDQTFARVVHMVDSPTKLIHPHVAGPALIQALRASSTLLNDDGASQKYP